MKLGVSMWSYVHAWRSGAMDIPGFIREVHKLGADGVELLDFFWKDREAELPGVEAALRETGLPVGVFSVANNFAQADSAAREVEIGKIKFGVDEAVHFGSKVVRVFAGDPRPGIGLDEAFEWIVSSFKEVAPYAADHGITLALENHGRLAGKSGQVLSILEAVGSPALGANPDTGNFLLVHEASHEAVAVVASRAAMAHFKDFKVVSDDYQGSAYTSIDGIKFAGTAVGEGDVDLAGCLTALKAGGFNGWLNIEYEAQEDPMTGVARSVVNAKRLISGLE